MKEKILSIIKSPNYVILTVFLLIGLFTVQSYGVGWDELEQRKIGITNYKYIFEDDDTLLTWYNRDYGPVVELCLVVFEKIFHLNEFRTIFLLRHLLSHLFFLFSILIFYKTIILLYNNKFLASIGSLFLLLHPRIYGHSFFNSKDIPFLAIVIICVYLFLLILDKKKIGNSILLGISLGILISTRIMGIYIPFVIIIYLLFDTVITKTYRVNSKISIAIIISMIATIYISWPFLWSNPVTHTKIAIANMSNFRWFGDFLFMGEYMKGTEIPWYYFPVWFILTTPIIFLICGILGLILIVVQFIGSPISLIKSKLKSKNLLILTLYLIPIFSVIVLRSVMYDGWRHLFFTYPLFVLIAIYAFDTLLRSKLKPIIISILVLAFINIGWFYTKNIPLEHTYFNQLFSVFSDKNLEDQFEIDYWGLSYKQALEYIAESDEKNLIKVSFKNTPGENNLKFLPEDLKNRFIIVNIEKSDYYITNFRQKNYFINTVEHQLHHTIMVSNYPTVKIYNIN